MEKKSLIRRAGLMLTASCLFLSLAACGSSTAATSTAVPSSAAVTAAPEEKTITVGMMASLYPYCYVDDDDQLVGYDLDMLAEADKRMDGYTFEYENLQYAVLFESLDTDAVDMLTGSINRTDEREAKYMTPDTDSGYNICSFVVAEDNTDINGIDDLGGKTIPFDPTRAEYQDLQAWNEAHPDNPINIEEMSDPSQADMVKMVADGRADAALIYRDSFASIQEELSLPVKMLDEQTIKKPFCQLINKDFDGAEEFCGEFQQVLSEMIEDGTLSNLSQQWLGYDMFAE